MENSQSKVSLRAWLKGKKIPIPKVHVVLGSGLGGALGSGDLHGWKYRGELSFSKIKGLNPSTAPGHKGAYRFYERASKVVSIQTGRLHGYEGLKPSETVKPVVFIRDLGTNVFLLTNAAGSLQEGMRTPSVMMIEDHVNFTGQNPLTGPNDERAGPRFPDMSQVYSPRINKLLRERLSSNGLETHVGIYICVNGPCFETPAEVKLFASWGMGAVGMSTVYEAIALKHRGSEVGGMSFLANMGAGLGEKRGGTLSGEEVLEEGLKKAPAILKSIFESLESL